MVENSGCLVISLDFELFWGARYSRTKEAYSANVLGAKEVIPAIIDLFEEYGVHATFATVGLLFCNSKEDIMKYAPFLKPNYTDKALSPYENNYLNSLDDIKDPYHSALEVINLLKCSPVIEIGTHTFSHYYCWEQGQTIDEFEADIQAAVRIATDNGVELKSIVFPRNYEVKEYLKICIKYGITSYRGNPAHYFNREGGLKDRLLRFIDTYVNISGKNIYSYNELKEDSIFNLKASRFLKPYSSKTAWLDGLKMRRIKHEMTAAAKQNKVYHLWWHPHNFGINQEKNLYMLEGILKHYNKLRLKYGYRSFSMKEFIDLFPSS